VHGEQDLSRYKELFDAAPVAYIFLSDDGAIVDANRAATRLLGVERDVLVLQRFDSFFAPLQQTAFQGLLREAARSPLPVSAEMALASAAAAPHRAVSLHLSVSLPRPQGGYLVMAVDMTERRRIDETLSAAKKMEAIGRLSGRVAHDLDNLLTVILMHASFALETSEGNQTLHQDLLELAAAARQAEALTRQLTQFCRSRESVKDLCNANEVAQSLSPRLATELGDAIRLELDLAEPLGLVPMAAGQFEQLLTHLLTNAREAMPSGGTVTIRTLGVDADAPCAARYFGRSEAFVLIVVRDTGVGMDAETASRVFEPFFSTKTRSGGRGVGLSAAYGLVHQAGGEILVQSAPGAGATFEVYLPAVAPADIPPQTA
jgi:two-component system cell cycle sensor histidine kinase/response regulator CckA